VVVGEATTPAELSNLRAGASALLARRSTSKARRHRTGLNRDGAA
jgi:hypothetical protein